MQDVNYGKNHVKKDIKHDLPTTLKLKLKVCRSSFIHGIAPSKKKFSQTRLKAFKPYPHES